MDGAKPRKPAFHAWNTAPQTCMECSTAVFFEIRRKNYVPLRWYDGPAPDSGSGPSYHLVPQSHHTTSVERNFFKKARDQQGGISPSESVFAYTAVPALGSPVSFAHITSYPGAMRMLKENVQYHGKRRMASDMKADSAFVNLRMRRARGREFATHYLRCNWNSPCPRKQPWDIICAVPAATSSHGIAYGQSLLQKAATGSHSGRGKMQTKTYIADCSIDGAARGARRKIHLPVPQVRKTRCRASAIWKEIQMAQPNGTDISRAIKIWTRQGGSADERARRRIVYWCFSPS